MPDDETVQLAIVAVVAYFGYRYLNFLEGFGEFVGGFTDFGGNVLGGVTDTIAGVFN